MKKFIALATNSFILSNSFFLIGLLLSVSLLWPLFWAPYFSHHDDVQIIRLYEMDQCVKDGQIPCRWVPDLGGLYGYPIFNYYAPLPYYFGEIIYLISKSLIFSAKFMFAVSFLGSYIFMFLLAQKFWGKLGGSLSAIFYAFAPYHALDFYVRGAMGELWALMFFPAILWAQTRLSQRLSLGNILLLGILVAFLITSHNLSLIIFLPVLVLWTFIFFLKNKKQKFLWFSLSAFVLGILLSAFYLIPMIIEKNLVHVDTTTYGYFGYTEHFKGIRELFIQRDWGWGSSIREVPGGEKEKVSFQIGWVHLLGWILALWAAWKLRKKARWVFTIIILVSLVLLVSSFMIHPRSEFIWKAIEPLKYLQFPWRFMMVVIVFVSFVTGAVVLIFSKRQVTIIWTILLILVVLANFSYFRPEKFIQTTEEELLTGDNWERIIKRSIFDFLPIYAKEPPAELAKERYQIIVGEVEISDFAKGSNWLKFKADVKSHTIIRLSQYYFPNWKIFVDGKEAKVEYTNNSLGLMTLILGEGKHEIFGKLYDTEIRKISNIITIASSGLFLILFITQFKKVREWIKYYRKAIN